MARIKSRPITLLAQGVGVNPTVKNGYNAPPPPTITQYMSAPYVSTGSQPGPTNVAAAQIYPAGQQVVSYQLASQFQVFYMFLLCIISVNFDGVHDPRKSIR